MDQVMERFRSWLKVNFEQGYLDLNSPATDLEIQELTDALGFPPPSGLVELLKIHNGQKDFMGWLNGYELLSVQKIIYIWNILHDLLNEGDFDDAVSEPQTGIKNDWWNKHWIPFASKISSDHLCVDMDPAEDGTAGQVIAWWHDSAERELLAPSLEKWFEDYLAGLVSGELVYSELYGSIMPKDEL